MKKMKIVLLWLLKKILNIKNHRYIVGDLVQVGAEDGCWEIAALYFKDNMKSVYMLRKDGQLREVGETHVERYKGYVDDLR